MKSFWKILLLLIVNILVSVGATLGALYYWENIRNAENPYELVTIDETPTGISSVQTTAEVTAEEPSSSEPTITLEPTPTLLQASPTPLTPAIRGAMIDIPLISNPGNFTSEGLRIVNASDGVVSLEGWTLEDADGHKLTFPNIQLLRNGVFIEVYSRSGHDTPYELYWAQSEAIWQSGETAVIKDQLGQIQATYRVP